MAMFADSAKLMTAYRRAITRLFKFSRVGLSTPSTDFNASFKSSLDASGVASFITQLAEARGQYISMAANGSIEAIIASVDAYIPLLLRLVTSMTLQKESLRLDRDLVFEWQGAIGDKMDFFKSNDVVFELLMVYHSKAMLHHRLAISLLEADSTSFLTEAGKHLLTAASVMDHMADKINSGGGRRFSSRAPNPPELNVNVCRSMSAMFKGSAQMMSVAKASSIGSNTPGSVLSRLCVGVVNSMKMAIDTMKDAVHPPQPFQSRLLLHMFVNQQIFTALSYQYHAQTLLDKKEVGNCIGCCLAAKATLAEQSASVQLPWRTSGLPRVGTTPGYTDIPAAVEMILGRIVELETTAERDNKFIYFQHVPTAEDPPQLPMEASVMNVTAYREIEMESPIVFEYKPKATFLGSIFGQKQSQGQPNSAEVEPSQHQQQQTSSQTIGGSRAEIAPPPSAPPDPSLSYSNSNPSQGSSSATPTLNSWA